MTDMDYSPLVRRLKPFGYPAGSDKSSAGRARDEPLAESRRLDAAMVAKRAVTPVNDFCNRNMQRRGRAADKMRRPQAQ
jgi:hypothetical protein